MAGGYTQGDLYAQPEAYDIIFDEGSAEEADFLEAVQSAYGRLKGRRWIEPACGTGRLMIALAQRGYAMHGFDLSASMLAHARQRADAEGVVMQVKSAAMEDFTFRGQFDLAYCLISSFKYLLDEASAVAHLRLVAAKLRPGGLYVLGLHLTDYLRDHPVHERWVATRQGVRVTCNTRTWPAEQRARRERVRNRLVIEDVHGAERRHECNWFFRTYDAKQLRRTVRAVPALELVACHDFQHDLEVTRSLDDGQEDIVLVLRKRA